MPIDIFTDAERAKLDAFPEEITADDLITFLAHVALEVKRPQKRRKMQHFKAVSPQNQHEPKILYEPKDIWQL